MVDEVKIEKNEGDIERAFTSCKTDLDWKPKTQESYKIGLKDFENFCRERGFLALPATPETLVEFLLARKSISIEALSQRLAVIRAIHAAAKEWLPRGHPERDDYTLDDRIIKKTWQDIKFHTAEKEVSKAASKAAVRSSELELILRQIRANRRGAQDRAILCIGLAYALKRSEIVAIDLDDVKIDDNQMTLRIYPNGSRDIPFVARAVARTGDATCPVAAMERWLALTKITQGAVFKNNWGNRHGSRYPATIIQKYGSMAGFNPEVLGAESLRKGSILDHLIRGESAESTMSFARIKPARYFEYLRAKIAQPNDNEERDILEITNDKSLTESARRTLIEARRGQGKFRDDLRKRWDDACAVTGCTVLEVLRASHIQPWSTSTNDERMNPANGLLLDANLDALFDRRLISFTDNGQMLLAFSIPQPDRDLLRVPGRLRKPLNNDEKHFLAKHRAAGGFSKL